jgi:Uma2 family endonuclease
MTLTSPPLSAEAYRALGESLQPAELVDGKPLIMPSPTYDHQYVVGKLFQRLANYLEIHPLGEAVLAPSDLQLDALNVVQPDLFFVAKDNPHCRLHQGIWTGRPDWVAEVLSPASLKRDREEKFALYARHAVPAYWLIDPASRILEAYALAGANFRLTEQFAGTDEVSSPIFPAWRFPLHTLFRPVDV